MADDETEVAPDDIVRSVADAMRGLPRAEPTAAELVARQAWLEECRQRDDERRAVYRQAQADAEARQRAADEHRTALERQEAVRRHNAEFVERSRQRNHERTVYEKLMATERFRNETVAVARRQAVIQQRQALLDDIDRTINPPSTPEPTVVVVTEDDGSADFGSRNFDLAKWSKKPRSWF